MSNKRTNPDTVANELVKKRGSPAMIGFNISDAVKLVLDKKLPHQQAIWACKLDNTVTEQKLWYHVQKEKGRRNSRMENAEVFRRADKEGMVLVFPEVRTDTEIVINDDNCNNNNILICNTVTVRTEVSPLTQATLESSQQADVATRRSFFPTGGDGNENNDNNNNPKRTAGDLSTTSSKKKKGRKSPRQAGEARLEAKVMRDDLNLRYKCDFKEATMTITRRTAADGEKENVEPVTHDQSVKRTI